VNSLFSLKLIFRFLLGNLLLPKLEKAAAKGENARVLTVLAAGKGGAIDLDDLGCKDNNGLAHKANAATSYNDLMVQVEFKKLFYPSYVNRNSLYVIQLFPLHMHIQVSWTRTSQIVFLFICVFRTFSLDRDKKLTRLFSTRLLSLFAVSQDECAEYMIYNLLRPEHKTGAHFIDNTGNETSKGKYYENDDVRAKVWKHAVEVTGLEDKS